MNPWQFITASILGFLMGWIYYRTRNVGYTIMIHMANNLMAFVAGTFDQPTLESMKQPSINWYGEVGPLVLLMVSAIAVGAMCIYYLDKRLPVFIPRTVDPPGSEQTQEHKAVYQNDDLTASR